MQKKLYFEGMDIDLPKLKEVQMKTQLMVFGFVRKCQGLLRNDSSYWNISDLIIYIVLAYCREIEYFEFCDDGVNVSEDRKIVVLSDYLSVSCYGHLKVFLNGKGVHLWKMKIIKPLLSHCVGIVDTKHKTVNGYYHTRDDVNSYCYTRYGQLLKSGEEIGKFEDFKNDDIVDMILDLNEKTLLFCLNGSKSKVIQIEEEKQCESYSMGVILGAKNVGIELLSYQYKLKL